MAIQLNPINKVSFADIVLEQLLDLLLQGGLRLGDKLPSETELASQLGVGRNSVREAMKVLQVLGVIERRQGDGSYVASEADIPLKPLLFVLLSHMGTPAELVDLRRVLEVGVVDLVIDKISDADLEKIEKTIVALEESTSEPSTSADELVAKDIAFHHAIFEATKNPSIQRLGKLIMRLFYPSMAEHLASPKGARRAVRDHKAIFEAIGQKDRIQAREMVIRSYEVWKGYIKFPGMVKMTETLEKGG
jgi:DNA-binding FadR family transcriptional regulator